MHKRNATRRLMLSLLVGACVLVTLAPSSFAADKIVLGLDWQVLGRHAGFFVAKAKGYYQREGLDVDIQRGYGAADVVKRVASGVSTFGFGDVGSLVLAQAAGIHAKAVAMIYGKAPYVLWTRQTAHINGPKDLLGKTIGSPVGASVRVLFPAFAQAAGIDASKVKWTTVDTSALYPLLFSGRVDAIVDYELGWPTVSKKAKQAGVKIGSLKLAKYGLDIYSNGLIATDQIIKEKPDLVRRFVKASLEGMCEAFRDPQEAAKILVKSFPTLDPDTAAAEVQIVHSLADTPEARKYGLGYMSEAKMTKTRDIIAKAYKIKVNVPVKGLYTDKFLPSIPTSSCGKEASAVQ